MRMAAKVVAWVSLSLALTAGGAAAQTVDTQMWITSGTVRAMARIGDTLYVGGNFLRVGPSTGAFVPVDSITGAAVAPYPKVNGVVCSVVPDGSGGWYLGGAFDRVGGLARQNLAHVLADGSVGAAMPAPDSTVYTMVLQGRTLFLGGEFKHIASTARRCIGCVDIPTNSLMGWIPDANKAVRTMALSGVSLYVGGSFDSLGGLPRARVGVVDAVNASIGTWNPGCTYSVTTCIVRTLAVSGGLVYVGGDFDQVGGVTRQGIVALNAISGVPTAWDPGLNAMSPLVYSLLVDGSQVYVGGVFETMGGAARLNLAAVDITSGLATAWDPMLTGPVYCLKRAGGALYVGGAFDNTAAGLRDNIAAYDVATGEAREWSPNAMGVVQGIAVQGANVYLAGSFTSVGCLRRSLLAAFDLNTGMATGWDPSADSPVYAMLATPKGSLIVGGTFRNIGSAFRPGIAEVDRFTGTPTEWNAGAAMATTPYFPRTYALALSGNTLYVGGQFTSIGGQNRRHLAALDVNTALATAWDPQASNTVLALAAGAGPLYVAGGFGSIGGAARLYLAAIDTVTGLATAWNPAPNQYVRTLAVHGSFVYAGGNFDFIGGASRSRIAALSPSTGLADVWNPVMLGGSATNRGVFTLYPLGNVMLVGGDFDGIGGAVRRDLAAINLGTGIATSWDPVAADPTRSSASAVRAFLPWNGRILAGGDFITMGNELQMGVASIQSPPLAIVDWADLHWPLTLGAFTGVPSDFVYGQVGMNYVTNAPGPDAGIEAQAGYGATGTSPETDASWTWTPAVFSAQFDNNDEYKARLTVSTPGYFEYAFRYRYLWGPWVYGDLDGSLNGFSIYQTGHLGVLALPHITGSILQWPPSISITYGATTPMIYGRVWGAGITDGAGAAQLLTAQLGYGPHGTDPATTSAWQWKNATYNMEEDGGGEEYMATLTPNGVGSFDYAYRFAFVDGVYTYSDLDGSADGYDIAQAGTLNVASTGVDEAAPRQLAITLAGANPIAHDARFRLGLPDGGPVEVAVYDMAGREVARVADGWLPAGWHTLSWASGRIAPAVYLARVRAAGHELVQRIVVLH